MCATKWVRDTSSTSSSWKRSCTRNLHLEIAFMLWLTVAQSFYPNPFFPLKMVGSHWPTLDTSAHSGEPPNGLKQLKRGSQ